MKQLHGFEQDGSEFYPVLEVAGGRAKALSCILRCNTKRKG